MQHTKRAVVRLAALGVAVSICLATPGTAAASRDSDSAGRRIAKVDVDIAKSHSISMPRKVEAGKITFDISCERRAWFLVVDPERRYSKAEFARDAHRAFDKHNSKALKRLRKNVDVAGKGPCGPRKGGDVSVDLDPGRYWALDAKARRIAPAKIFEFRAR
ncbi:MAG: hypothetical protein ACRDPJ_01940 [Nocardioidaceae bacterium]